jgi:hypothetical protein
MRFRIMASRHSAFYTPLLTCIAFLREDGHEVSYSVLGRGQRSYALLRDGQIDIMQSAVSSNWPLREQGIEPLPVHFAQINQRDGFFIVGRQPESDFPLKNLEGKTLIADHGSQPLVMLKYALKYNGVDWKRIKVVDSGSPDQMEATFRSGTGDYIHLQAPVMAGEILASVGASMPPVAFSSLCCARAFQSDRGLSHLPHDVCTREGMESNCPWRRNRGKGGRLFPRGSGRCPRRNDYPLPGALHLGWRY